MLDALGLLAAAVHIDLRVFAHVFFSRSDQRLTSPSTGRDANGFTVLVGTYGSTRSRAHAPYAL